MSGPSEPSDILRRAREMALGWAEELESGAGRHQVKRDDQWVDATHELIADLKGQAAELERVLTIAERRKAARDRAA